MSIVLLTTTLWDGIVTPGESMMLFLSAILFVLTVIYTKTLLGLVKRFNFAPMAIRYLEADASGDENEVG